MKRPKFLKYCRCGCGESITWKDHYRYYGIPDYAWGHHVKTEEGRIRMKAVHLGTKLSDLHKNSISVSMPKTKTKEHIKNQSDSRRGKPGCTSEVARRSGLIGIMKLQSKHFQDTKPELAAKKLLDEMGIKYSHPYPVWVIEHSYPADFYIPKLNTILEIDGKYYHKYPIGLEIDKIRNKELQDAGYRVLRVWEDEVSLIPKLLGDI